MVFLGLVIEVMKKVIIVCYALSQAIFLFGVPNTYLYPLDVLRYEGKEYILTLWQKEPHRVELYRWDPESRLAYKELCLLFNPAGIAVLPNKESYSFVDNGRIRIKDHYKRSPIAIDFDIPLFNISLVHWLTDEYAYCHAQEGHRFGIYSFFRSGEVRRVRYSQGVDYLFPSVVEDMVYYICRRSKDGHISYAIASAPFSATSVDMSEAILIEVGAMPIAFLSMHSPDIGFVIAYQKDVDTHNKENAVFHYYMLERDNKRAWKARQLFSFDLPTYLFSTESEHCLYESILPFLPYHIDKTIYYSSAHTHTDYLQFYSFNIQTQAHKKCHVRGNRSPLIFKPYAYHDSIIAGGLVVPNAQQLAPEVVYSLSNYLQFNLVCLH